MTLLRSFADPITRTTLLRQCDNRHRSQSSSFKTEYHYKYPLHPGDMGLGCNMVVPAEIFARVGSFDERFGPGAPCKAGEETDFFWRAHLCKVPIIYVPQMVVYHFHGRKNRNIVANYIISNGARYAKHLSTLYRYLYWDLRKGKHIIARITS